MWARQCSDCFSPMHSTHKSDPTSSKDEKNILSVHQPELLASTSQRSQDKGTVSSLDLNEPSGNHEAPPPCPI